MKNQDSFPKYVTEIWTLIEEIKREEGARKNERRDYNREIQE